ncbi:MAG: hypothetical protein JW885_10190 [Deltaproteobacteria bacterium]|nr:hypothetical protein [Candidatus Zymogenaceae bacterium]
MTRKHIVLFLSVVALFALASCATSESKPKSYYLSSDYLAEIRAEESGLVMSAFYDATDALSRGDYAEVIERSTEGIAQIPTYKDLFVYFYAIRAYSHIMVYDLDAAMEDIGYLSALDKDSLMVPFLYTYYYLSYAPFFEDSDYYFQLALEYLNEWRATQPTNYFETMFSDPGRIAEIESAITTELNK